MTARGPVLTALSIIPNRGWPASRPRLTPRASSRSFPFNAYPSQQALEIRLRQTKPDVVLLDLATDLDLACKLIRCISSLNLQTHVVGLHVRNDSDAVLRSLRMGASEFLFAPFEVRVQNEAVARLHRLSSPARRRRSNRAASWPSPAPSRDRVRRRWRRRRPSLCVPRRPSACCSPISI